MKKLLLICALATCGLSQAYAQLDEDDFGFFNHAALGVSAGTDGIGIELAAPLTYNFAVRAGYNFMPKFKYKENVDLGSNPAFINPNGQKVDLEGELNMGDFKILFDWYPFTTSSFRLTAGAYIGKEKILTVKNTSAFVNSDYWGTAGIELGTTESVYSTYTILSDEQGNVKADLKVNSFKPYIGIGFGRAVPKNRLAVQFDLGVQIWGTPEVWTNIQYFDYNQGKYVKEYKRVGPNRITNPDKDYQDAKDAIETISKIGVYPVLTLRLNGRIF